MKKVFTDTYDLSCSTKKSWKLFFILYTIIITIMFIISVFHCLRHTNRCTLETAKLKGQISILLNLNKELQYQLKLSGLTKENRQLIKTNEALIKALRETND